MISEPRGPNAERSRVTRQRIVTVASERFRRDGFASVSVDDIAGSAGVTKGAVYHHFGSKGRLLEAVVTHAHRRTRRRVVQAVRAVSGGRAQLLAGCRAYLSAVAHRDMPARLLFVEAPAVLGWQRWRELDDQTWRGDLLQAVAAIVPGHDDRTVVAADAIGAVLLDAALMIASGRDPEPIRGQAEGATTLILDALTPR